MNKASNALLGAALALPLLFAAGGANAAPPPGGHYIYVPAGATVVVLPGPAPVAVPVGVPMTPTAVPVASLIAQQQAMMDRMVADMNAMFSMPMPSPQQMLQAAMHGMPMAPGNGLVLTSSGNGVGVCSETITYGFPANGGKPQVHVTRSGNACGPAAATGPADVVESPIAPHPVAPVTRPLPTRMWTASEPAHPIGPADPRA